MALEIHQIIINIIIIIIIITLDFICSMVEAQSIWKANLAKLAMQVSEREGEPEPVWNQAVSFFMNQYLKDACEVGLRGRAILDFLWSWARAYPVWDWTQTYKSYDWKHYERYILNLFVHRRSNNTSTENISFHVTVRGQTLWLLSLVSEESNQKFCFMSVTTMHDKYNDSHNCENKLPGIVIWITSTTKAIYCNTNYQHFTL